MRHLRLKKIYLSIIFCLLCFPMKAVLNDAQFYDLTGKVEGKYPVTIYLVKNGDTISGKMFYHSTIAKQGVKPSSYLYIHGIWADDDMIVNVYDISGNDVEKWVGNFSSGNHGCELNCVIIKPNGKRMIVEAVQYF